MAALVQLLEGEVVFWNVLLWRFITTTSCSVLLLHIAAARAVYCTWSTCQHKWHRLLPSHAGLSAYWYMVMYVCVCACVCVCECVCVCVVSTFLPYILFRRLNHKGWERGRICSMHEQIRYAYEEWSRVTRREFIGRPRRIWRVRIILNWTSATAVWWCRVGSDGSVCGSVWALWTRQWK